MDSSKLFTISFLFLSWSLHGFSSETKSAEEMNSLGQGIANAFRETDISSAAADGTGDGSSLPCLQTLIPCQPFLNSGSPPPTCCSPLKGIFDEDVQCLCQVFNNPEILKGFNLTIDEAMTLPKKCGISSDISVCKKGSPPSNSTDSSSKPNAAVNIANAAGIWFISSAAAFMFSIV